MNTRRVHSVKERLEELASFLTCFESPDFKFGSWQEHEQKDPQIYIMPRLDYAPQVDDFMRVAYDLEWVRPEVDWPTWKQTAEAVELRDKPETLASATVEQLEKLLTTLIRQERFVDGALLSAHESGLLTAIIRRAQSLSQTLSENVHT